MKIGHSVKFGAWILITLNILMSFGSIWIFIRMAPAIEIILLQNEVSLEACETMLASLLRREKDTNGATFQIDTFRKALAKAKNNITEKDEPAVIQEILLRYEGAFQKGGNEIEQTVNAILKLGKINRDAMSSADYRARQLGLAGAWGVVFMASTIFLAGMLFLRSMRIQLVEPLMEIQATVSAFTQGETMRRCSLRNPPRVIRLVFKSLNELLDAYCRENSQAGGFSRKG